MVASVPFDSSEEYESVEDDDRPYLKFYGNAEHEDNVNEEGIENGGYFSANGNGYGNKVTGDEETGGEETGGEEACKVCIWTNSTACSSKMWI